ncbi:MAG: PD-(D/E)XK nuclease family protein [Oscillospiraceae bacterium]|nr:PD-(D/E)XK nuclease family protein [Oscillospiraceae bacterium]
MLNLLLGKDWVANRNEILHLAAQDVRQGLGNRILMVPELISHDMERRLCAAAGDTASRYAEVLSFTRLARRVADSVGFAAQECLDDGGRVVAMAAAARQLHSKLKAYAAVETKPEFLTGLVDAVDEFKRCCISAADLKAASKQTEGSFAQKLEELSLLLEAYDSLCQRGKRDPRDQMTWLLEQLCDSDFGQRHVFYIDGFPDLTRQHFAILEHLIQVSPNVTVSLNCDAPGSHLLAFEKAADTAQQLIRCAQRAGVPVNIRTVAGGCEALRPVREGLFQGELTSSPDLAERLQLYRADSVHQQCQIAAQRVQQLVHSGCRYRQIAVVCTDPLTYHNTIQLIFNRCKIPLYQSGTEDILQKSVVSTVLSAMDAALGGFDRQDVMRYLKSSLSPLELDTSDLLENYAILWGIQGSRWQQSWEYHPDGLDGQWDEESRKRLNMLNEARCLALEPLFRLREGFRNAKRLKDQVSALCVFFEDIGLEEHLRALADEMDAAGDNRSAQILNQLWEILIGALEQLYDVLGETAWDAETFTRLFALLLSQYDVGTIPPVLDAVTVGPVSAMRCQEVSHLIILGAQEGLLPGYCGSGGILTDQERVALRDLGVPLTGGSMDGLQAEFSEIYGVFCGARETVTVCCGAGQPSYVYRRLATLAGEEKTVSGSTFVSADALDAAAYLAQFQDTSAAQSLGVGEEYRRVCSRRAYGLGAVDPENIRKLYGKKLRLSASQVDRQAECRLAYFLKYGLRAKECKEASVDPAEFGTYVHAVLEHTAAQVMALGGFHQVSLEKTMQIALAYSQTYAAQRFSQLDSQRAAYLFQRNIRELEMIVAELWQELSTSLFDPVDFEVAFGDGAQMEAIEIPGGRMDAQLRGFVDRVDAWKKGQRNYFRVVDYKTGRKDFDYCDVFNGLGLQMLLYLFALEQGGQSLLGEKPVPAGVQYFPARSPLVNADSRLSVEAAQTERSKNWKRKGLVLLDDDVLDAMEPEGSPKRLSCTRKKDGTVTGDTVDPEQLRLLKDYIFRLLRSMVDEIASGKVDPNPYTRGSAHDACTYCPYKAVCHYVYVEGRRNYKAMSAQRFWEEIGKEMEHRG